MAVPEWSRLPVWWIVKKEELRLRLLDGRACGASIAALKIYIALVNNACNAEDAPEFGTATTSFSKFEDQTGLSRAMVSTGIRKLIALGVITKEKNAGQTSCYHLIGYEKLPHLKFLSVI